MQDGGLRGRNRALCGTDRASRLSQFPVPAAAANAAANDWLSDARLSRLPAAASSWRSIATPICGLAHPPRCNPHVETLLLHWHTPSPWPTPLFSLCLSRVALRLPLELCSPYSAVAEQLILFSPCIARRYVPRGIPARPPLLPPPAASPLEEAALSGQPQQLSSPE